jgi:hypothetical protein
VYCISMVKWAIGINERYLAVQKDLISRTDRKTNEKTKSQRDTQTERQTTDRKTYRQVKTDGCPKNVIEFKSCHKLGREKVAKFGSGKIFSRPIF